MARSFDYSKWDNIELSDDESDLHPNIDKESWFRMKHRSRLEREEKEDKEIAQMELANADDQSRIKIITSRIKAIQSGQLEDEADEDDIEGLQGEADELTNNISKRNKIIQGYKDARKWNIDNICKVSEERSIVNKSTSASLKAEDFVPTGVTEKKFQSSLPEETSPTSVFTSTNQSTTNKPLTTDSESSLSKSNKINNSSSSNTKPVSDKSKSSASAAPSAPEIIGPTPKISKERLAVISYNDFVIGQEDLLERYSEIPSLEASKEMIFRNCDVLLHEHSQSYMLLSCLEDEMNGKHERMRLVARQSQILSHINELGVSMKRDPRDVILPFFRRLEEKEHLQGFLAAIEEFIMRIKKRAVEKKKEMDEEREGQDGVLPREQRLGPGGLDPLEVLPMLPKPLQEAFESRNVDVLKQVISEMTPADAKKWMKMCVDSGLWVPQNDEVFEDDGEEEEQEEDGENVDEDEKA